MIKVTLTFNTAEEALATLKRLEGTAAEPLKSIALGKSAKTGRPAETSSTAAPAAASETKPAASSPAGEAAKPIDFKADIAPKFLALAKLPAGGDKQAAVVKHFGVERLSQVDKSRYQEVLEYIENIQ